MVGHLLSLLMFYSVHKGLFKQDGRPFSLCRKIKSDIYRELNSAQREEKSEKRKYQNLIAKKGKESRHDANGSFPLSFEMDGILYLRLSTIGLR